MDKRVAEFRYQIESLSRQLENQREEERILSLLESEMGSEGSPLNERIEELREKIQQNKQYQFERLKVLTPDLSNSSE